MRADGPLDHIEQARWRHRPGNRGGTKPQTAQIASRQAGPSHKAPLNHIADLEHAANKPCFGTPTRVAPILRNGPILHFALLGLVGQEGQRRGLMARQPAQSPGHVAHQPRMTTRMTGPGDTRLMPLIPIRRWNTLGGFIQYPDGVYRIPEAGFPIVDISF
jgi:hypothetical protein